MINGKGYDGANWVRVDLHLHSPGVDSFEIQSGIDINSEKNKKMIIERYVEKLKKENIRVASITDYNQIHEEWFIPIKEAAKEHGIIIFPGVELSVSLTGGKYGLHFIVVFGDEINIDGLNTFLHSLDKDPQKRLINGRSHRDINSDYELDVLIKRIREKFNCLIIFAHPEEDKGLFKSFTPGQAAIYISLIKPDSIEFFSDGWKNKLISTGKINAEFLNKMAIIENSDPKSIEEIGTKERNGKKRATYIKLSDFSLEALRLALHDPEVRIRLYELPEMFHSRITKIDVNGTTFLKEISLNINPELNTFIGGRGVGKSAILESIRYCLDLPVYAEKDQKIDFVSAVVGSGGEISVELDKYYGKKKTSYRIKRIIGKEPEVYDEKGQKISLYPSEIFDKEKAPIIIGQKELYVISQDERFLLQLIDQLIGDKVRLIQKAFEDLNVSLRENGKKIMDLENKLVKKDEYEQELKTTDSKIKEYENLGVAKKLESYTLILEDDEKINYADEKLKKLIQQIENVLNQSKGELKEIISSLRRGKSEKRHLLENLAAEFEGLRNKLEEIQLISELTRIYETKIKKVIYYWNLEKEKSEKEIEEIKKKLGEQKLQPEKLEELTRRKAKLESLIKEFEKNENELKDKKGEREQIKAEVKALRHQLFKTRDVEIQKINKKLEGKVKINIIYEGEKKEFKKYISNLFQGSGIHKNAIDSILEGKNQAIDGILISDIISSGKEQLIKKYNLSDKMAEKVIEYFKDKNKLFELETLFPEDLIEIELNVDGKFMPLIKLSPGQRATALLLLIFTMEDRILILDQPEEDLDNRFIYEDVVNILRKLKGKRQIITATHNANIPVIGDAELIVVLEKSEDRCMISDKGSIDKASIKESVKRIMEGGEEAFRKRAEKYGGRA
jgi:energy-coupling factor transporter ATP-binding protein EcfA2